MRIATLHSLTSARLVVIAVDATLQAAASALTDPQIGLLVVGDENRNPVGVVSKSDLVRHVARAGMAEATVRALMSRNIISSRPDDDLYATWQEMAARSLKHMPVLGTDSKPLGVLDIRDALKVLFEREEREEGLLINYIAGVGYH